MSTTLEYAVLDTETTGLGPRARLIEIGVVTLDAHLRELTTWTSLVRVEGAVGATRVHGIDAAMAASAPHFHQIAPVVAGLLQGRTLVGHNLVFDWNVLRRSFTRCGWTAPAWHGGLCTLELARPRIEGSLRLADVCGELGVEAASGHRALADARATVSLFRELVDRGWVPRRGTTCGPFRPPLATRSHLDRYDRASGAQHDAEPEGAGGG